MAEGWTLKFASQISSELSNVSDIQNNEPELLLQSTAFKKLKIFEKYKSKSFMCRIFH